jgi:Ca2+/Na+ antiporter
LGSLGFDKDAIFPERIVRLSTRTFVDSNAQDIPPGLMGQMWLDCGILGPVIWGVIFAAALSFFQIRFDRKQKTPQAVAFFMMGLYILSLPLNTGSFDFVFSVDIVFLVLFLLIVYKRVVYKGLESEEFSR